MGKNVRFTPEEEQPEVPAAQPLAQQAPGDLREPVVERPEQREHGPADQHVVEVGDDEVGVVHQLVERYRGDHHPGEPADDEQHDEAEDEQEGDREARPPVPDRRDPAEDLDPAGNRDHHARGREEALAQLRQAGGEHVVHPEAEAQECRCRSCESTIAG